jgi:hypothetical protein
MRPFAAALSAVIALAAHAAASAGAAAQPSRQTVVSKSAGVLGIMGYSMVPDGTASAIRIDPGAATDDGSDSRLTLGQIGAGFTWSDTFPLYLEGFIGYARYDPTFVFSDGTEARRLPTRWNSLTATVGWDFRLADRIYLRPIVNAALGYATSDAKLLGTWLGLQTGVEPDGPLLDDGSLPAFGLGGAMVLAYYDHLPRREIDVELRYT